MGRPVGTNPSFAAKSDRAGDLGANHARFSRGHTAGVEGPHRQLGAGLTNRLSRNDSDRFTKVDQLVMRQSPAVTLPAHGAIGLTGQRGTDAHRFNPGFFETA